jgi:hypothetical protein
MFRLCWVVKIKITITYWYGEVADFQIWHSLLIQYAVCIDIYVMGIYVVINYTLRNGTLL